MLCTDFRSQLISPISHSSPQPSTRNTPHPTSPQQPQTMSQPPSPAPYHQKPYYAQDVDFDDLAARDPEWAAICKTSKATRWLDFQDPAIVL